MNEIDRLRLVKPNERLDDLQRSHLMILQDPERFCFGMDAVLLSDFARARAGDRVLDLGTGTGILPLLMSAKTEAAHFDALEIQHESADMASRSVRLNGLEDRITIIEGDIREADAIPAPASYHIPSGDPPDPASAPGDASSGRSPGPAPAPGDAPSGDPPALTPASYDVITCNPPYLRAGSGIVNPADAKAIARHELLCTFADVARASERLLKPGGHLFLVHRPHRLPELMNELTSHGLEPKRLRLCYPRMDREPDLVLIEAVRGGRPHLTVERPMIIWKEDGTYTDEVRRLYGF